MLHPRSRWICSDVPDTGIEQLAQEARVSKLVARMLAVRGIADAEQAHRFLHADIDEMHDPYLLAGMEDAVARIRTALANRERIRIYGDYDADGVSSTSLMIYLMRHLEADFDYYIPHRANEGYGLNKAALEDAKACGITLVVTVDTGISAVEEVAYARELGIDIVVTDHHEPPEQLPDACALVNPKLSYCPYPFKGLAGVGVAFKLAHALLGRIPEEWLELAAIGTVADLMPLLDENRILVRAALQRMKRSRYAGIRALLQVCSIDPKEVTSTHIAFSMAPRINASGRLDHADIAVQLLTAEDDAAAEAFAWELDRLNKERQKIVDGIVKEAEALLVEKMEDTGEPPHVIVLAAEGWNVGVIGIVASKILEKYYRPTFVLGIDGETGLCKGSARSIPGFDLYEAMQSCGELFEHYGGHQAAAGMTIQADKLEELEQRLQEVAEGILTEEHFVPCVEVDAECGLNEIPLEVIDQLEQLAPFGMGNPSPRVVIRNARVREIRTMGKEGQHLKLMLSQDRATLDAVAFHRGGLARRIASDVKADVLGELSVNEWNGRRRPQLFMQDIRIQERQLFDLRGIPDAWETAVQLARILEQDGGGANVLVTTREQAGVHAAESFAWLYSDEEEGPVVVPGAWRGDEPFIAAMSERVREMVLFGMPPSEQEMRRLTRQLRHMERLHVVLPREPIGGRLHMPTRDRIKRAYAELRRVHTWTNEPEPMRSLAKRVSLSLREFMLLLDMFQELQFLSCTHHKHTTTFEMAAQPAKTSLEASQRYRDWASAAAWEQRWYEPPTEAFAAWLWSCWDEERDVSLLRRSSDGF
ncbi:single-stranded-DNA-specific exonuclease RecJ [Paenibacillus thiaminolyticus]|nr:single-stranded-DNA-specific exonuclease RecJ [Paenibacillus thiaminolyticus]